MLTTIEKSGWKKFLELCHHARSQQQLDQLFDFLLTIEEKKQIAMRVELIKALLAGEQTQRTIAKELDLSIAKITRGSNALKRIDPELKAYLQKNVL